MGSTGEGRDLEVGYFVTADRLAEFTKAELVIDPQTGRTRQHPRGSFCFGWRGAIARRVLVTIRRNR